MWRVGTTQIHKLNKCEQDCSEIPILNCLPYKENFKNLVLAFPFFIEIWWDDHFSTWSPSANLNVPLASNQSDQLSWRSRSRVFLRNQGSRKVNVWDSSIAYPSMIRDHTLQILRIEKGANPGSVEAFAKFSSLLPRA
jgi:hypothetical protein